VKIIIIRKPKYTQTKNPVMKKSMLRLIGISILLASCSKLDNPKDELSIEQFYAYCNTVENACGIPLNHEGEYVTVIGYIQALNTFEEENRFQLFQSPSISSARVEIHVTENKNSIFKEIDKHIDNENMENFTRFKVTGKIIGIDLPTNGNCNRSPFLELNSTWDIKVKD
jgi:hypothetical protein